MRSRSCCFGPPAHSMIGCSGDRCPCFDWKDPPPRLGDLQHHRRWKKLHFPSPFCQTIRQTIRQIFASESISCFFSFDSRSHFLVAESKQSLRWLAISVRNWVHCSTSASCWLMILYIDLSLKTWPKKSARLQGHPAKPRRLSSREASRPASWPSELAGWIFWMVKILVFIVSNLSKISFRNSLKVERRK